MANNSEPSFPALDEFQQRLREGSSHFRFQPGIEEDDIRIFETAYSIELPPSYRQFLQICDGGMITPEPSFYYQDMTEEEPDGPIDSSFYLYPLNRVLERYEDMMLDNWLLGDEFEGIYPIIPIGQSPDKRLLFVFSQPGFEKESPVYISLKKETGCAEVSENFSDFLHTYLKADGFPHLPDHDRYAKGSDRLEVHKMLALAEDPEHPEHALERYNALLKLNPKDAWYYSQRGLVLLELEQRQKALQDFNQAIRIHGDKALYRYCRGDLLLSYGSPRQALIDLDLAVRLEPKDMLYRYLRASAFFALKRYPEALEDCNISLDADSTYILALLLRAEIYHHLGEEEKARADEELIDKLDN